jgi:hypothetical protein
MPSEAPPYLRLMDCGSIRSGQSFRKAPIEDPQSQHFVIQTKDLLPTGCISQELLPISTLSETPKPNVEPGDILILSRGVRFNAGVVWQLPGLSTALNMFYIFKPRPSELMPEFIVAYLNNPITQERLKRLATGVTIPHLKADDLGSIRIPVPSLQQQRAYVALMDAAIEEKALLDKLSNLRRQQLRAAVGFSTL